MVCNILLIQGWNKVAPIMKSTNFKESAVAWWILNYIPPILTTFSYSDGVWLVPSNSC